MHCYKAKVIKILDGDSADLDIDCGFKLHLFERVRFYGIDTPETRTKDKEEKARGLKAKRFVVDMIEGKEVKIETVKQGKFGRYLATIYYDHPEKGADINLNKELVDLGLAKEYWGGKR